MTVVNRKLNWIILIINLVFLLVVVIIFSKTKTQPGVYDPSLYQVEITVDQETEKISSVYANKAWSVSIKDIKLYIIGYFLVTAFFSLIYATDAFGTGYYSSCLKEGINWLRWLQLAFTFSLVFYVIAFVSGIKDYSFVIFSLIAIKILMFQGGIIESFIGKDMLISTIAPAVSLWIILFGIFAFVIIAFNQRNRAIRNAGYKVPAWNYWLLYPMIIFYVIICALMMVQIYRGFNFNVNYLMEYNSFEIAYIIINTIAQIYLGLIVSIGYTLPNNSLYNDQITKKDRLVNNLLN